MPFLKQRHFLYLNKNMNDYLFKTLEYALTYKCDYDIHYTEGVFLFMKNFLIKSFNKILLI